MLSPLSYVIWCTAGMIVLILGGWSIVRWTDLHLDVLTESWAGIAFVIGGILVGATARYVAHRKRLRV